MRLYIIPYPSVTEKMNQHIGVNVTGLLVSVDFLVCHGRWVALCIIYGKPNWLFWQGVVEETLEIATLSFSVLIVPGCIAGM